jgi:hypothetical protein
MRYRSGIIEWERSGIIEARLLYDRMVFRGAGGESPAPRIGRSIAKNPVPGETIVAHMTGIVFNAKMQGSAEFRKEITTRNMSLKRRRRSITGEKPAHLAPLPALQA